MASGSVSPVVSFKSPFHHHAFSYEDPHPDHAATGEALRQLQEDGNETHALYYVPRYVDMEDMGYLADVSEEDASRVREALAAYNIWDPERGLYAVGCHSIPRAMVHMMDDPQNRVHE